MCARVAAQMDAIRAGCAEAKRLQTHIKRGYREMQSVRDVLRQSNRGKYQYITTRMQSVRDVLRQSSF